MVLFPIAMQAQKDAEPRKHDPQKNLFDSIELLLPTPNVYRTGSGAPGPQYWQNTADYNISVELVDSTQMVMGEETITYTNNSPDALRYLFLQLEQNYFDPQGISQLTESTRFQKMTTEDWNGMNYRQDFPGGIQGLEVSDASGRALTYQIHYTNLRVDLPAPLGPGGKFTLKVKWRYQMQRHARFGARTGFEEFADGNRIYELAHWFPRMMVYNDAEGWQNQQFLGQGEFALPFGNYQVQITLPADFVVAATGELTNASRVLAATQLQRWKQAQQEEVQPVLIITQAEADENAQQRLTTKKTWIYKAEQVRDFAWAASRRFIWDAMKLDLNGKPVMCMSYYPREGNPLWEKYSTKAIAHAVKTYSKYTADFPWPTMISVNGPVVGMEYPMITFNGPRPEADGTYSLAQKNALISVIFHEVGHNFFPMLINSDERDHTWQDEGFNTFIQYLTEQEWELGYNSRRGPSTGITDFLRNSGGETIHQHSDRISQFRNTQYLKVAAGLNILRETVMGRQLFDFAFKTYCQRWAFKHPRPADFFRSMEDASGVDLDWFWRGWWMGSDPVDINLATLTQYELLGQNPERVLQWERKEAQAQSRHISQIRNERDIKSTYTQRDTSTHDFYTTYDPYAPNAYHRQLYTRFRESLSEEDKKYLDQPNKYYYQLDFVNEGGMMMPLVLQLVYQDGSDELMRIPVEIWRRNNYACSKALILDKPLQKVVLDPYLETADIDRQDNVYPREILRRQISVDKPQASEPSLNPMQLDRAIRQDGKGYQGE
ncbi:MAG: M1 family metallopeptidase [Bacteroidetes bacterium]|nr:M1 family metallopeptidase [Bacteroidota bacterium]